MALTPLRWLAIAVAGFLLSAAYYLGVDARPFAQDNAREVLLERERQMNLAASRAADKLRVVQLRDSIARSLRALPAADSVRVVFGAGVPTEMHEAMRNAIRLGQQAATNARSGIDVVIASDTGHLVRGVNRGINQWLTPEYVLPRHPGERCLVLGRVQTGGSASLAGRGALFASLAGQVNEKRLLGPCAYIASFGLPGAGVAKWLADGAWGFAMLNDWTALAAPWQPPSWAGVNADGWAIRYYMTTEGFRCVTSGSADCAAAILSPRPAERASRYPDVWGRHISAGSVRDDMWYRLSLGPQSTAFLSDMVRELGAERFRRFWTSPAPVSDAFREAAGRELADFTHDWMTRQYGSNLRRGPSLHLASLPVGMIVLAVGAGAAMFASRRRQVV